MRLPSWIPTAFIAVLLMGTWLFIQSHQRPPVEATNEPSVGPACPLDPATEPHSHPPGEGHLDPEVHSHPDGHSHSEGDDQENAWNGLQEVDLTEAFTFRPEQGERASLRYRLAEPAQVQIRVKHSGTRELFLATLLNWERREAGEHVEIWDGCDYSGNRIDMSKATMTLFARPPGHGHEIMPLDARTPEEIVHSEEEHKHETHHPWAEEVPTLQILEPQPQSELSGVVVIRSQVDEDQRGYGDIYGYGVRYYVDGVLAREEFYQPESNGTFAYRLDTTAFPDGAHLLRVGMCDHHQHASSASVPVVFSNSIKNPEP